MKEKVEKNREFQERLDAFFESQWDEIETIALKISPQAAYDIIGAAWIRLSNLSNPDAVLELLKTGQIVGLLHMVLRYAELDRKRKAHAENRRTTPYHEHQEFPPTPAPSLTAEMERRERIELLKSKLNEVERQVLEKKLETGAGSAEIAQSLKISRRYVEKLLARIRLKLNALD